MILYDEYIYIYIHTYIYSTTINSLYNWMVEYHTNDQFGMGPGGYTNFLSSFLGLMLRSVQK